MFSKDEAGALLDCWNEDDTLGSILAVATKAAELLAARGGTMRAEKLGALGKSWHGATVPEAFTIRKLLGHIAAQGARVAVLEEENSIRQNIIDAEARKTFAAQQHISDLEKSLENARKERDEEEVKAQCQVADRETVAREALDRAVKAERERDEAVADNAAKHKAFEEYVTMYGVQHGDIPGTETTCPEDDTCECAHVAALNAAFGPGHPGSALLERLKRLEACIEALRAIRSNARCLTDVERTRAIGQEILGTMAFHGVVDLLDGH